MRIAISGWGAVFSQENTPEGHTGTHKSSIFSYKQVSGENGDHECLRMTNAFISLCNLLWKVQKSHRMNWEGSSKNINQFQRQWAEIGRRLVNVCHIAM